MSKFASLKASAVNSKAAKVAATPFLLVANAVVCGTYAARQAAYYVRNGSF